MSNIKRFRTTVAWEEMVLMDERSSSSRETHRNAAGNATLVPNMKLVTIERLFIRYRNSNKKMKISPISHQTGTCISTFPNQMSALIPCTRLYPNSQRIIANLGTLVRMRWTDIQTARKAAQIKDRMARLTAMVVIRASSQEPRTGKERRCVEYISWKEVRLGRRPARHK